MALLCEREDWTLFRNLTTLGQKAGVPVKKLACLVVKELVDNACDETGDCRFGELLGGGIFVEDNGPGIPGSDEEIAALFSINRPLRSSKLIRLPTRGALGNGLRVVAGAVLASGGALTVMTRGRALRLAPRDGDGTTQVAAVRRWRGRGTRVEVRLGPALESEDENLFLWAEWTADLAGRGKTYGGRSSPWWYDSDSFWELCSASGDTPVRDLVGQLEGCGGDRAGAIAQDFLRRGAASLSRGEAEELLKAARTFARRVNVKRLGCVGTLEGFPGHAREGGTFEVWPARGSLPAEVPFVVEAWAREEDEPSALVCVNRTPCSASVAVRRQSKPRTDYGLFGCNLRQRFKVGRGNDFDFVVNVLSP